MKILFLCGGLEPGKDGVGDYTRRLAGALTHFGIQSSIIALNDTKIATVEEGYQPDGDKEIGVLRLPSSLSWPERMLKAQNFVDDFNPDLLSLQFVPYSFHAKGLPFGFAKKLKKFANGRKWHVMYHELWVGIKDKSPLSHYFYSFLQKNLIKNMHRLLNPACALTSNRLYQLELKEIEVEADLLPLFSNISIATPDPLFLESFYHKLQVSHLGRDRFFILGVFGSFYKDINFAAIIQEHLDLAKPQGRKLAFVSFGRLSDPQDFNRLEQQFKDEVVFLRLGELPDHLVSTMLQQLDTGICSTPEEYIGKSGVYAAMRLHNVPVVLRSAISISKYEREIKDIVLYLQQRAPYKWDVSYIANKFYENIRLYSNI